MPSESFVVRRLGSSDAPLVRTLNALFGAAFGEPETYRGAPPAESYLTTLLARESIVVLVALRGDAILGGLVAYELEKLERQRSEFYLYDLAVDADQRRQGIATALIDALRGIAAGRGAEFVFVQADHGDDPAIALYRKLGTGEEVLHFDIATPSG